MYATPNKQKLERNNLQVGASSLPPSAECRHLGVTIHSRLTLASHVRAERERACYAGASGTIYGESQDFVDLLT